MPKKTCLILALLLGFSTLSAQPKRFSSSEIHQKLRQLNVLGTVLYVAAHPDDENTAVISYYRNERLFRTGYLAATRGDGGQNLIGPEIREQLGLIRTQELLGARGIDGGQQFFSRANDFGYSKNPEETFNMWDKQEILADFVWVFRKFRPDVIITRFDDQPPNHGHHTASAILAREAFKLAADIKAFPEQLRHVDVWEPQRVYWNTHPFFFRNRGIEFDTASYGQIPIGNYNAVIGMSYSELSSLSRSMHKSQGFGSTGTRGDRNDYITQWEGSESLQPFEGIDTSWGRVKGGNKVQPLVDQLLKKFDPTKPALLVSELIKIRSTMSDNVKDEFWKTIKIKEIDDLIISLTGTYLELTADDFAFTPGDSMQLSIEAVNRSDVSMVLKSINLSDLSLNESVGAELKNNQLVNRSWKVMIPSTARYTSPYWLEKEGVIGRYKVEDQLLRGLPENPPTFEAKVQLEVEGKPLEFILPVKYKRNDPVDGEVYRPLVVQPPVMANIESSALIFSSAEPKEVSVRVIAGKANVKGEVILQLPEGWISNPQKQTFELAQKNAEQVFSFMITPPEGSSEGEVKAIAQMDGQTYDRGRVLIEYDHIPTQTIFTKTGTRVVKLDIKTVGNQVGYIMGAGDDLPQNLAQIGYEVTILEKDDVLAENIEKFQAVILGVRAFNTVDWLAYKNQELFKYVENGGNLIVQYNTTGRLVTNDFSPFDLKISRERTTVEEAEVRILAPDHPAMNVPNKISSKDFEGWVQERGLYFPDSWANEFTPILSCNDPGESPLDGGLLIARYGKGNYVYTGYSWFRELPAGVAGAYRIFANLISLPND